MAPKVGEKGVALKVGEKAASHLTPLLPTLWKKRLIHFFPVDASPSFGLFGVQNFGKCER